MDIVSRFLSFDKLMGASLVKLVYYLGIIGIILSTLGTMFSGFALGIGAGLWMFIVAPIGGLIALLFWRFVCELYIVLFRLGEDVSALRAGKGPTL
jgi:hypothetical protein